MIWTILLIVLITVAALFCIMVSFILFPVFTVGIYAVFRPENKKVQMEGSWLHPRIVTFTLNPISKEFTLTFLGRRLFGSKSKPSSVKSEPVSQSESSPAKPEPGTRQVPTNSNEIDEFEVVSSRPDSEVRSESEIHSENQSEEIPPLTGNPLENEVDNSFKDREENDKEHTTGLDEAMVEVETKTKIEDELKAEKKTEVEVKIKDKNNKAKDGAEAEKVKDGFLSRLKKNRYLYMIRQRKLQKKLFRWGFTIFRSLFRIIRFNHFDASVKAGIEEPALLGNVYAIYTMTRYTVNISGGGAPILKFEPVFMKNWFEGEGRFSIKASVVSLMWPAFLAVTTFPYITVLWLFWKSRKLKAKTPKKS
jgi:hypothetical protein